MKERRWIIFVSACLAASATTSANAHVKWFAPYDIEQPPLSLDRVFTPSFVWLMVVSLLFMYVFFFVDRFLYRRKFLYNFTVRWTIPEHVSFMLMRIAIFSFFTSTFIYGITGSAFLLTPDLSTDLVFIPWMQLVAGLCALSWLTTPLTGLAIFIFYGIGIYDYGVFHMLDYLIFLGIASYFLFSRMKSDAWKTGRYVALFATTGLTLLWASIEKWGYPGWTYPLLENEPGMLMGLSPYFYMLFAGFVEFNVTFILMSSASAISRICAFGLNLVFVIAIYKFGMIDAIGHLMIIVILLILVLQGPTSARYFLVLPDKSLRVEAFFMASNYAFWLVVIFTAYYGIYHLTH